MKIEKITSKLLDDNEVSHGFIKRSNGVTTKVSPLTDAKIEEVSESLMSIAEQEFPDQKIALLYLVGGHEVVTIDGIEGSMSILDCDAAVTKQPIVLALTVADCMPILLIDKVNSVLGITHGGWKNMAGDILTETVEAMKNLGAQPENILAAIGPSICVKCFEVGEEVAQEFDEAVVDRSHDKPHVDLWQEASNKLKHIGIYQIDNLKICTFENTNEFYSARKDGVTGRFLAYVGL